MGKFKNKILSLRLDIKKAYGDNVELLRMLNIGSEKYFVLNDILELIYDYKKIEERRCVRRGNILKVIKLGKVEKRKILSFGGTQYTTLIDQIALLEIIAYKNKNLNDKG